MEEKLNAKNIMDILTEYLSKDGKKVKDIKFKVDGKLGNI